MQRTKEEIEAVIRLHIMAVRSRGLSNGAQVLRVVNPTEFRRN